MLHLRVVNQPEHTDTVLRLLGDCPGATHLVHLPGAGIAPRGDVIEADVARESLDDLLAALCALGIDHDGAITLESIDTSLSDHADRAEAAAPGEGADAVVWEELIARTGEESRLNFTYLGFLTIACLLAAVGVVTNSAVTIVGAMVVGPEFGPLAALAVGIVRRRWDLARRAAVALGLGFPLAMFVTAGLATIGHLCGLFDASSVSANHDVDFVFQVGPFSLIVALLAGAAGMLSLTSSKSAALVGVFISVTTVPAAGYAALAVVLGEPGRAASSALQLLVNLVGIILAAVLVLLVRNRNNRYGDTGRPLPEG
ncbi:putative hydrophobic protein (TIGR00271 family) [Crossiella equi]|uniref:Hydrophobic protein (TIGR00271 family) n=1 Tax=Crossiella equi TaxID=130796 RepID=A0ABS5A8L4_9PSEU|nr:DUF389 domain-containing protein [Crossiella equi]MBP2472948.1 putative hydrophobic protein (TIGR00271 family) [Crossiella equi]